MVAPGLCSPGVRATSQLALLLCHWHDPCREILCGSSPARGSGTDQASVSWPFIPLFLQAWCYGLCPRDMCFLHISQILSHSGWRKKPSQGAGRERSPLFPTILAHLLAFPSCLYLFSLLSSSHLPSFPPSLLLLSFSFLCFLPLSLSLLSSLQ